MDFAQFLAISYGPIVGVGSQSFLALDQGSISKRELDSVLAKIILIAGRIVAHSKSLGRTLGICPKALMLYSGPHRCLDA